jgi:hypothetical protein
MWIDSGVHMGEAEDVVLGQVRHEKTLAEQRRAQAEQAFIAEVQLQLIPRIQAMLRASNYSYGETSVYGRHVFRIDGIDRVAWRIYYDGWEGPPESYITADGNFILGRSLGEISTVEELVVHHGEFLLPRVLENLRKMARGEEL